MKHWTSPTTRHYLCAVAAFVVCALDLPAFAASPFTVGTVVDLSSEGTIPNAFLGSAVAVDHDTAVVAGLKPGGFGLAIVYARTGSSWQMVRHLEGMPGVDPLGFGYSLSLSGDTLAVLSRPSTSLTSAISIFVRTAGVWSLQKVFTQNDWPVAKVTSMALSGDTLCFGSPTETPAKTTVACGFVDVFRRSGSVWAYQKTLCPADPQRAERFGASIALDGDRLAVGTPVATVGKVPYGGACYVFTRTGDAWKQTAKLTSPSPGPRYQFGATVALSGGCLLVSSPAQTQLGGSPFTTYVNQRGTIAGFSLSPSGLWQSDGFLPPPLADPDPTVIAAPQVLGTRIALAGCLAVISNPTTVIGTDRSYIYQRRGSRWVQLAPIIDNGFDPDTYDPVSYDPADPPLFNLTSSPGGAAAVSGRTILIGAPNETTLAGVRSGRARFYNVLSGLAVFDGPAIAAAELAADSPGAPINVTLGDLVIGHPRKRSFSLQNLGDTALTGLTVTCENPDVVISSPTVTTLQPQAAVTVTLSITPMDYGDWEALVVARASTGSVTSTLTLDIHSLVNDGPSPPAILADPVSVVLREQGSYDLSADVSGSEPLAFKWFHNGRPMAGATSRVLSLAPATLASVGTYELQVTNEAGGAFSGPAEVSVYQVPAAATLKFNEGNRFELDAPVSGKGIRVAWFLNGTTLADSQQFSGTTTPKLVVKSANALTSGKFTAVVNPGEQNVAARIWNVSVLLRPVIQSDVASLSTVSVVDGVTFHFVTLPAADSFVFKGVPPGIVANTKTGTLTGKPGMPGNYTLRVAGTNPAGTGPERVVSLTVPGLDSRVVGTGQALVARDVVVNGGLGGSVTLAVASNGRCTGSVFAGTRAARFVTTTSVIPGSGSYRIDFVTVVSNVADRYILDLDPTNGRITGQLVSSLSPGTQAAIAGWVSPWSVSRPATAWRDYATLALSPPATLEAGQHAIPFGHSHGTLAISPTGAAVWAGRMADGTVTTAASAISDAHLITAPQAGVEVPLHFQLYAGKGSAQGMLAVLQGASHAATGSVDWFKQPVAGRSYASGIPLHTLAATGGHYAAPAPNKVVLNLPVAVSNARLVFAGAGIEQAWQALLLDTPLTVATTGQVFFDPVNPVPGTLLIDAAKGTFSGSMTLADPHPAQPALSLHRKMDLHGVLLEGQGLGFFTLPALPSPSATEATSAIESGSAVLQPAN